MIPIAGKPVLQHLVERVKGANLLPLICTSIDPTDDEIVGLAEKLGVKYFRGSLLNKVKRWADCAVFFNSEYVHIIDADDPLIDTSEILESINEASVGGLDLLRTSDRSDSGYASVGMTIRSDFLVTLSRRVALLKSQDLDVIPWKLILEETDRISKKQDKVLVSDSALSLRLTLDYETDLELISSLIEELGNTVSRLDLERYLESHPTLATINAGNTSLFLQNKKEQLKRNFDLG
jgi:spore coat polysaccharide biosynthesis protein SpsF